MGREEILKRVQENQPALVSLPNIDEIPTTQNIDVVQMFKEKLELLHVAVFEVESLEAIKTTILNTYTSTERLVTTIESLQDIASYIQTVQEDAHSLENVELAIIPAHFGVAENGAVWVTESIVQYRVLPFIAQQLAVVISKQKIVANMHEAYKLTAGTTYDFGVFIAGPSKTADIEQSLVLGAHGPKGMMLFLLP